MKYFFPIILFASSSFFLTAQGNEAIDASDLLIQGKGYLTSVEKMPIFPGCEMIVDKNDRYNCSEIQFTQYIQERISYPKLALDMGCEGVVYVSFIINKNGILESIESVRDQTPGCGLKEEALRVVSSFNYSGILWEPGEHNGESVNVKMLIPIKFGTSHQKKSKKKKK